MTTVTIQELRRDMERVLELAESGEPVRILVEGRPDLLLTSAGLPSESPTAPSAARSSAPSALALNADLVTFADSAASAAPAVELYGPDDEGVREQSQRIARDNRTAYARLSDLQ